MLLQTLNRQDFVHNFYFKYFDKHSPDPGQDLDPEPQPVLFRGRIRNIVSPVLKAQRSGSDLQGTEL
jgi:hypothetical protein